MPPPCRLDGTALSENQRTPHDHKARPIRYFATASGVSEIRGGTELYPRVGFIVTNLTRPNHPVVKFYNGRGTAEQWIREGKNAIRWKRLSCRAFKHNAVRLQLHALAYNLANVMRALALPEPVEHWSLTALRES